MKICLLIKIGFFIVFQFLLADACTDILIGAQCKQWKERGFCNADSRYVAYVKRNCNATCGDCKKRIASVARSIGACADHVSFKERCQKVKSEGHCEVSSPYYERMEKYCPASCGFCETDSSAACQDNDAYKDKCAMFKASGYCAAGQLFYESMIKFCPKTCDLCKLNNEGSKCAQGPNLKGRVVGGRDAEPNSWPWQAALIYEGRFDCGGTLVSPSWVMTAAHCVYKRDASKFQVVLGGHDREVASGFEQVLTVEKIIAHRGFNFVDMNDDIALLMLARPAIINEKVQFACLPTSNQLVPVGTNCYITGWGKTSNLGPQARVLQEAALPTVSNAECAKMNAKVGTGKSIQEGMLCAGFGPDYSRLESGCRGDSGGPFACNIGNGKWTVEGVVSSGSSTCRAFEKYTVFTRVSYYRSWIDENMKGN